jgi:SOS-response transcriptional repressor LexA
MSRQPSQGSPPHAAKVPPFRRLEGSAARAGEVPVELHVLKIAAGRPDNLQYEQTPEWVVVLGPSKVEAGMVVAQIEGDSMAPLVMPGEYALFAPVIAPENGMIVLAQLRERGETRKGGRFVLKKYRKLADGQIQLESLNKAYEPILVKQDDELRVVARWVEVLRGEEAAEGHESVAPAVVQGEIGLDRALQRIDDPLGPLARKSEKVRQAVRTALLRAESHTGDVAKDMEKVLDDLHAEGGRAPISCIQ